MSHERLAAGWIRRWSARPYAPAQLLFLPHAGGCAGFVRAWDGPLDPAVELLAVQYPGREDRRAEPVPASMPELVGPIADAVTAVVDRPWVLFGHSLGAAVAYELARELHRRKAPLPRRLVVSGRAAPGRRRGRGVHLRDDAGLIEELERLGGLPPGLGADPGALRGALGPARADFRIAETYRPDPGAAPLPCPLTVFTGDADPELGTGEALAWAAASTTPGPDVRVFPGGHFYLVPQQDAVLAALKDLARPA